MTEPNPNDNKPDPKDQPNGQEEITKVLEDLKTKLDAIPGQDDKPKETVPSFAEIREQRKKQLGFSEEQMRVHEQMLMEAQAPLIERAAWSHIEKKADIDKYRKEIEDELKIYSPQNKTPDVLEKIYYMVKGRHADSKPADVSPKPSGSRVADARVSRGPGYSGAEPGMPAGGGASGDEEDQLTDAEKFVASKMGIPEKEYAKSKKAGREIRELRAPDTRQVNSLADVELRRLQSAR